MIGRLDLNPASSWTIRRMRSTASSPLLLHNTMRIRPGHLEQYKAAVQRAVEFVEEHGPQIMVQVFIDDERLEAHSFQLYPDSDAILAHWKLSDPYIQDVMQHCTVERLEMFGEPDERVRSAMSSDNTGDVSRRTFPRLIGFLRQTTAAG
jgi:hypothetical protein